jgi:plastocyanin domain-containing protein
LESDGRAQNLDIDASTGPGFAPAQISAEAGIPIELDFSQGEGCLDEVVFEQFGIRQSLAAGPTTVKLPALEPGTYAFNCGMGHQEGSIVVQ